MRSRVELDTDLLKRFHSALRGSETRQKVWDSLTPESRDEIDDAVLDAVWEAILNAGGRTKNDAVITHDMVKKFRKEILG